MEKIQLAITVLLTGIVVVFTVLFVLIAAIKIYGTIVYTAQQKKNAKKQKKAEEKATAAKSVVTEAIEPEIAEDDDTIPDEIIAVIGAAVDAMYSKTRLTVKSVKRVKESRSAWSSAGLLENTRPF